MKQFNMFVILAAFVVLFSSAAQANDGPTITDYQGPVSATHIVPVSPEPGTFALMGMGLLGLAVATRLRKKK